MNPVKVKCRNCNRDAPAEQFKLHYQLKMMVCPDCFTGKGQSLKNQVENKPVEPAKPAGWDKDDEYLERVSRMKKEEQQAQFSKIPGTDLVKCTCPGCKFNFRYSPEKKQPHNCPYCNLEVPKFKFFSW